MKVNISAMKHGKQRQMVMDTVMALVQGQEVLVTCRAEYTAQAIQQEVEQALKAFGYGDAIKRLRVEVRHDRGQ